jgi:hypothetical protein
MSFSYRLTLLMLSIGVLCAGAPAAGKGGAAKKGKSMEGSATPYALKIKCNDSYVAGFPLLVALEVSNISKNHHTDLPIFDLFLVPGSVEFVLRGGGHEWTWPSRHRPRSDEPGLTEFPPGKAWLAMQDLSELHPDIPPGHYKLSASMMFPGELVEAPAVAFEVSAPTNEDRAIATRLLATNSKNKRSWLELVTRNPSAWSAQGLSAAAHATLDYYLYLQEVESSGQPLASRRPNETDRFAHGALEAEAAVLRLELLYAAGRPEAPGIEAAVLERWPGLAWRVEKIRAGAGLLNGLHAYPHRKPDGK